MSCVAKAKLESKCRTAITAIKSGVIFYNLRILQNKGTSKSIQSTYNEARLTAATTTPHFNQDYSKDKKR